MMLKTISFSTLGCRLNQAEEERLRREFLEAGFYITEPEKADICIVNTCSVTSLADKKCRQAIRNLKTKNKKLKIVALGCGAESAKSIPEVDLSITNQDKPETFSIVSKCFDLQGAKKDQEGPKSKRTRALLKIQDGCNNFCAYCIVPVLRGREVSVSSKDVLKEAQKLEKMGYEELVITGVNVGKYTCEISGMNLTGLMEELLKKTSFPRIRLSSVNPQDITDEMIDLWSKKPRLCPHFHLSLQSGSTSVLKRMGRPYTAQFYYSLTEKIRKKIPDVAITTDVIVGFPGETDTEFEETLNFVKKVKFAKLHVFRYSKRVGTRAESMGNQVKESIKTARSKELIKLGEKLEKKYKDSFIGKELVVLFEEEKNGYWYGLTSNYIRIKYKSSTDIQNKLVPIVINKENLA